MKMIIATASLIVVGVVCAFVAPLAGEHNPHHGFFNLVGQGVLTVALAISVAGFASADASMRKSHRDYTIRQRL